MLEKRLCYFLNSKNTTHPQIKSHVRLTLYSCFCYYILYESSRKMAIITSLQLGRTAFGDATC